MIGNDVVDISEAKKTSNWRRPRFLEKLFTTEEQRYIKSTDNEFLSVWKLWAIKEAAYKLYTQKYPSRFFAPKAFECLVNTLEKKVKFKDFECYVSTKTTRNYIVAEAQFIQYKMVSKVIEFQSKDFKKQRQVLRQKLLENISKNENISSSSLKFQKLEYGIPIVNHNSETIAVSLSHHGRFGTFAHHQNSLNKNTLSVQKIS